jgi:hypothetical protein
MRKTRDKTRQDTARTHTHTQYPLARRAFKELDVTVHFGPRPGRLPGITTLGLAWLTGS